MADVMVERGTEGRTQGAAVYVVTEDGVLEASAYVALGKDAAESAGSQQVAGRTTGRRWVEPRYRFDDLLSFYDTNVWHRRCCQVKALLVAGVGWELVRGRGDDLEVVYDPDTMTEVPEGPAARLVAQPNGNLMETWAELLNRLMLDFESVGNGYLEVVRDAAGRVAEVYHVPARTVRRGRGRGEYVQVKQHREAWFDAFGRQSAGRNELLHLHAYDPLGDDYGVPGWLAALANMGLDRTLLEFNINLFRNALMAHVAVVVKGGKLSKAGRDAVQRFVRERATGAQNAGRVLLIESEDDGVDLTFEKLNLDVGDLMIVEAQRHFRDVVIGAHGVPPRFLGVVEPGRLGSANEIEGQMRIFDRVVLGPRQRRVERAVDALLCAVEPGCALRFRLKPLDVTDARTDARLFDVLLKRGVLKPEDVRPAAERLVLG